ncbi:hypothetical protein BB561_005778 [Smittium simulii]|uniref:Pre-mRNA-splicing factor 38 C-terminal domain-containing protein n=1 Tax=Smittium simulii TaxID=133385 RepID=A0A2T9Y889_9FUNG|nr:hypothetical protein BB561_005778 [Smittium simulii]
MAKDLLVSNKFLDTTLPRIPVPIQRNYVAKLEERNKSIKENTLHSESKPIDTRTSKRNGSTSRERDRRDTSSYKRSKYRNRSSSRSRSRSRTRDRGRYERQYKEDYKKENSQGTEDNKYSSSRRNRYEKHYVKDDYSDSYKESRKSRDRDSEYGTSRSSNSYEQRFSSKKTGYSLEENKYDDFGRLIKKK